MGEWQNGDLGLYDFGARLYNPVLARWQCTDAMDQFDSPYNAMGNNPVINIDPDGMFSIPWGAIMSNIGNALSSVGRTTTRLIGMHDFVSGASVPVYASSTTRPFANLGSALNIAGTILSMGMDAKAILDAAGEMGAGSSDKFPIQPNIAGAPVHSKGEFPNYQVYQITVREAEDAFSLRSTKSGYFRMNGGDWDKIFFDPNIDDGSTNRRGVYYAMKPNKVEAGWSTSWTIQGVFDQNGLIDNTTKNQIDAFIEATMNNLASSSDVSLYSPMKMNIYGMDNFDTEFFGTETQKIVNARNANVLINQVSDYMCQKLCEHFQIVKARGVRYINVSGGEARDIPIMGGEFGLEFTFRQNVYGF